MVFTPFKSRRLLAQLSACLLLINIAPAQASSESEFKNGLQAFRSQLYRVAIQHFEMAYRLGDKSSTLAYNLAVSHFKLENYSLARKWFLEAANDSKIRWLCEYNLGLTALKQNNTLEAESYFSRVANESSEDKLVRLAEYRLGRLAGDDNAIPDAPKRGSLFLQLEFGQDSNVTAVEDTSPSKKSSAYRDTYVYGAYTLAGEPEHGLTLDAYVLDSRYDAVPTEDVLITSYGLEQSIKVSDWQFAAGIRRQKTELAERDFQQSTVYELKTIYDYAKDTEFRVRYRHYDIESEKPYQELSGTRQRLRLEYRTLIKADKLRLYYELETNDLQESQPTSSYSPNRYTGRLNYTLAVSEKLELKADLAYRRSYYPSNTAVAERIEDRQIYGLEASYYLNSNWFVSLKFKTIHNQSDQQQYNYNRQTGSFAINMVY